MADSNRFVNPYNFISLPNKKAKAIWMRINIMA